MKDSIFKEGLKSGTELTSEKAPLMRELRCTVTAEKHDLFTEMAARNGMYKTDMLRHLVNLALLFESLPQETKRALLKLAVTIQE